jgi:hypothetical protein
METLREMLVRREAELLREIGNLRDQLQPLEAELAEVRTAHAAISVKGPAGPATYSYAVVSAHHSGDAGPYADLTMKELAVKALNEHFQNGATANQMLEFFRNAWGRKIERSSFSPQLTRLKREGVIARAGLMWHLMPGAPVPKSRVEIVREFERQVDDMFVKTPDESGEKPRE